MTVEKSLPTKSITNATQTRACIHFNKPVTLIACTSAMYNAPPTRTTTPPKTRITETP